MGALSPEEQRAFEEHLVGCERCAASVAELSGMTGLLDRVPLDRVLQPGADREPLPDLLLGRIVGAARKERRRRSVWLVASGAVAAAAVAVAIAVVPVGRTDQPAGTTVAMTPVRPAAVTGTLVGDTRRLGHPGVAGLPLGRLRHVDRRRDRAQDLPPGRGAPGR